VNRSDSPSHRYLEAIDPLGGTERVEYWADHPSLPATVPTSEVPTGFTAANYDMDRFVMLYWDKRAMALQPRAVASATITKLLLRSGPDYAAGTPNTSIPSSIKRPLESRVWYQYPNQSSVGSPSVGTGTQPSVTARVLDDGSSQIWQATYNSLGQVTSRTDPVGRRTSYVYAANGIDLLEVRQMTGSMNDLLATYSNYTATHLPQTITDAAGQSTTITYNAAGQVLTLTNAKSETTTYAYDAAGHGHLQSVTWPVAGATTTYTYDSQGRVRTIADADGYTVTMDYDSLGRRTKTTYPDGTYDQRTFHRLDVAESRDRLGRITRYLYDAQRRLVSARDPLGRTTTQQWCGCGSLEALIDAKGQKTSWQRDIQGRVTHEVRADGVTATVYTYEATTSRLKTITDPKLQVTTYSYNLDDSQQSMTFTNAAIATPSVSFTYDPAYYRQTTMVDGTGTTSYTYHSMGVLGAGQLASVDGPLTNDTITYAYDELGRVTTRGLNGVGLTYVYDALGRVNSEVSVLGTFAYGYHGTTTRVASVLYPNGQTSTYEYFGNAMDHRLQTIHHKRADTLTLSRHDYTYDATGNILTWQQQVDSAPSELWRYAYDASDQVATAVRWATDGSPTVLRRYVYSYDPVGNRTTEQIDDAATLSTHDALNRLTQQQPGGTLRFAGTVSEPATVTIQGKPVIVDPANNFSGTASTVAGTNAVTIQAVDPSGNVTNVQYNVTLSGTGRTFFYDANGNLTSDGTRSFEWDARNQLVAVSSGTHRSEFTYDGQRHRVRILEKESGTTIADTRTVWCDDAICEERAADGTTVTRRAFEFGEQINGVSRFFTVDHLGSVTEQTDAAGTVLARYAFDPSGRRALIAGSESTTVGFTGHFAHGPSSTYLAMYRAYDPDLGRWLSEDPLAFDQGPNFYAYVNNQLTIATDPLGLAPKGMQGRPRKCNATEDAECSAICIANKKSKESCMISRTFRFVRMTQRNGTVMTMKKWFDGPMSCSCEDNDPDDLVRSCGENCVKVLVTVGIIAGSVIWVCLTRLPPPVPA
jgi:RHS repeat-associated protein